MTCSKTSSARRVGADRRRHRPAIYRGYTDPPRNAMRYNGRPVIGIGVSNVDGGNVITIGEAVNRRLQELLP